MDFQFMNQYFQYFEPRKFRESRNLIAEQQYGFKKGRSTTDVVVILQNHIAEALRKRESTTTVPLDLSKAYDMSWRYSIVKKDQRLEDRWKNAVLH
jgi:hypothetical protein